MTPPLLVLPPSSTSQTFVLTHQYGAVEKCLKIGNAYYDDYSRVIYDVLVDDNEAIVNFGNVKCEGSDGNSLFEFQLTDNNRYKIIDKLNNFGILAGAPDMSDSSYFIKFYRELPVSSPNVVDPWLVYDYGDNTYSMSHISYNDAGDATYYCLDFKGFESLGDKFARLGQGYSSDAECRKPSISDDFKFKLYPFAETPPIVPLSGLPQSSTQYYVFTKTAYVKDAVNLEYKQVERCIWNHGINFDFSASVGQRNEKCGGFDGFSIVKIELTENNRYKISDAKSGKVLYSQGTYLQWVEDPIIFTEYSMEIDPWYLYDYGNNRYVLLSHHKANRLLGPESFQCVAYAFHWNGEENIGASQQSSLDPHCGSLYDDIKFANNFLFNLYPYVEAPPVAPLLGLPESSNQNYIFVKGNFCLMANSDYGYIAEDTDNDVFHDSNPAHLKCGLFNGNSVINVQRTVNDRYKITDVKSGKILAGFINPDGKFVVLFQSEDSVSSDTSTDPWIIYDHGYNRFVLSLRRDPYTDAEDVSHAETFYCLETLQSSEDDQYHVLESSLRYALDARCQYEGDRNSFANKFLYDLIPTSSFDHILTARNPVQVFDLGKYNVLTHKSFNFGLTVPNEKCLTVSGVSKNFLVSAKGATIGEGNEKCGGFTGNSVFEFQLTANNRYKITDVKSGKILMGTGTTWEQGVLFESGYNDETMGPEIVTDPWLVYHYGDNRYALKHMRVDYESDGVEYPSSQQCLAAYAPLDTYLYESDGDFYCDSDEGYYVSEMLFGLYPVWIPPTVEFGSNILAASRLNKLTWKGSATVSLCSPLSAVKPSVLGITSIVYNWSDDMKLNTLIGFKLGRPAQILQAIVEIWT